MDGTRKHQAGCKGPLAYPLRAPSDQTFVTLWLRVPKRRSKAGRIVWSISALSRKQTFSFALKKTARVLPDTSVLECALTCFWTHIRTINIVIVQRIIVDTAHCERDALPTELHRLGDLAASDVLAYDELKEYYWPTSLYRHTRYSRKTV